MNTQLDWDRLEVLHSSVRQLRKPDRRLGLEVLAALEPNHRTGRRAAEMLSIWDQGEALTVAPELDLTGSMNATLDLLDRVFPGEHWVLSRRPEQQSYRGDHRYVLELGPASIRGWGGTAPGCILDAILNALVLVGTERYQLTSVPERCAQHG